MTPLDRARADYAMWSAVSAIHRAHDPKPCWLCSAIGLQLDAASIAYDLAMAEAHNAWSGPGQKQAGYVYP